MSETVEITILTEDKKGSHQEIKVTHDIGATLMSTLLKTKLISGNFCGGRGSCGRCRVQFMQGIPLPTSMERRAFNAEELRGGYRLACMVRPKNSCVIRLDFIKSCKIDVVTDMIGMSEVVDPLGQDENLPSYLIAVDLGTTTIAMQLMDGRTGQVTDTHCAMNPQRSYGADVLSRIQAANTGNAEILRSSVWEVLQEGTTKFHHTLERRTENDANKEERTDKREKPYISCMCIAGNTAMEHILMGLSTENLGRSPFTPVTLGLQKCFLADWEKNDKAMSDTLVMNRKDLEDLAIYITPGISAFVGGDIVAGLYSCHLLDGLSGDFFVERTDQDAGGAVLFIDLGTNGEMAITDGRRMIVTATAAGPAFEGGAGAAVPGSDMIAVTASLLKQGILDETGLLAEPYFEEGITVSPPGKTETIRLTQKDIRDLQMAKAAVRAGVDILQERMGHPDIRKVYLAGGFGYYLDVDAALAVGLLPENLRECAQAVGNTSLAGAYAMGRDLCIGRLQEETLMEKLHFIRSINLAETQEFERKYLSYLNFPVKKATEPHKK